MKKIFLFLAIFSLGAFFLGIILKKLEHGRVKSVKFGGSKIYNFILVNKNVSRQAQRSLWRKPRRLQEHMVLLLAHRTL
ncbi:MAG TPA: hypothetical protein EYP82_08425, partial [Hydrogenothermaceae bacterium]|nr:hypothetical protein [Hydrogenothermaceae bacterium]